MSRMIIYLDRLSPDGSSNLPFEQTGRLVLKIFWSCFGWGLHSPFCYQKSGSLLHCPSNLTGKYSGGIFLLHYPWSHLHRTLSGILPYEARTFLTCKMQPRSFVLLSTGYYIEFLLKCKFSFQHLKEPIE